MKYINYKKNKITFKPNIEYFCYYSLFSFYCFIISIKFFKINKFSSSCYYLYSVLWFPIFILLCPLVSICSLPILLYYRYWLYIVLFYYFVTSVTSLFCGMGLYLVLITTLCSMDLYCLVLLFYVLCSLCILLYGSLLSF